MRQLKDWNRPLELLAYQKAEQPYHKTKSLYAIRIRAWLIGDMEIEVACNAEIERIRAKFITNSDKLKIDINVGYSQRNSSSNLEPHGPDKRWS